MGFQVSLRGEQGFTLAELLVTMLVIALLLGIAIAAYVPAAGAASSMTCQHNQRVLQDGADLAMCTGVTGLDDVSDLAGYVVDYGTVCACPKDGALLAYDPDTNDVSCPNHP